MSIKVIALDLERTLIDTALSARPRPGLLEFLTFCDRHFARVALFTTVEEADAREVMDDLGRRGHVPLARLDRLEYVEWVGEYKALEFVPGVPLEELIFVDDDAGWIRPDQRGRWVPIAPWDGGIDTELLRIRSLLRELLSDEVSRDVARGTGPSDGV